MKTEEQGITIRQVSEGLAKAPYVLQDGSITEFLHWRPGDLMDQQAVKGSLCLAQWEAQWQEFLRTWDNPHSGWGIPDLSEKSSPWKDTKAFLNSFEQVAEACKWPPKEWVTRLLPALSGEPEKYFRSLNVGDRDDYGKVKAAILRGDALSREKQREEFRHFCYQEAEGPRGAYSRLQEMCRGWLRVENHSKEQILELLILEQLLNVLPPEIQSQVRESGLESCSQVVILAEELLLKQRETEREEKQVLLEEVTGSASEADQDQAEGEQRYPLVMGIKEEEDGEANLLGDADAMAGNFQGFVLGKANPEDSEGNFRNGDGPQRQDGSHPGRTREEPIPCQVGGFHAIQDHEVMKSRGKRKKNLHANQKIHCGVQENESTTFGKTSQNTDIISQEQIPSGKNSCNSLEHTKNFNRKWALSSHQRVDSGEDPENENDDDLHQLLLDKANHEPFQGKVRNQGGPRKQEESYRMEKIDKHIPGQAEDLCEEIHKVVEIHKCGMNFIDQRQYNRHLQMHTGKKTHDCLVCRKSFIHKAELIQHQTIHTAGKPYSCSDYDKSFSQANLFQHQRIYLGEKPFICSESLSKGGKSNEHFPDHNILKAHKCFPCEKYFRYRSGCLRHQRTHTGEKLFECSACGKKFNQNSDLQKHQRTHTGEKPFQCSACGKKFSVCSNLNRHQRTHTGEKPFECSECEKKFSHFSNLQKHQRIHTGEKPFECLECGKKFTQSWNLQQHQRTHTRKTSLECSECGKKFSQAGSLRRHQRTHMGESF